jgi:hypothetical protein
VSYPTQEELHAEHERARDLRMAASAAIREFLAVIYPDAIEGTQYTYFLEQCDRQLRRCLTLAYCGQCDCEVEPCPSSPSER